MRTRLSFVIKSFASVLSQITPMLCYLLTFFDLSLHIPFVKMDTINRSSSSPPNSIFPVQTQAGQLLPNSGQVVNNWTSATFPTDNSTCHRLSTKIVIIIHPRKYGTTAVIFSKWLISHRLHYITLHYRHFKRHLHLKWPVVHQQLHVIQNTY